ncbi:MAG: site-2 protease family protein [Chloroflexi bacterium]|nr:site-2 protease family protein [Chloroflexota bacterium]
MQGAFRIARIAGVEISVHYTWLFAFFLITWTLGIGYYPHEHPGWSPLLYWVAGGLSALLLFGSVLLHELAHSFMALARGLPVQGITLFIFGGVSSIQMESQSAGDEFIISAVGPLTSLALSGGFWTLSSLLPNESVAGAMLQYLTFVNVLLAVFNLVPGFPLDGGRLLRAALWGITGSLSRATGIAARVGQMVAFLLIVWGVVQLFSGNILGGLWIAFIGWFLNSAAESSRQEVTAGELFRRLRVGDLMDPSPETVPPELSVDALVRDYILRRGWRALPVCQDRRLLGIVSLTDVREVEEPRWPATRIEEVMTRAPLYTVAPGTELMEALDLLADHRIHQVLVVEDGHLVGLLTRSHILEYLQLREELGFRGARR